MNYAHCPQHETLLGLFGFWKIMEHPITLLFVNKKHFVMFIHLVMLYILVLSFIIYSILNTLNKLTMCYVFSKITSCITLIRFHEPLIISQL